MQIPEGYSPIPSSRKGGFRRRNSSGAFDYWYPGDPAPGPAPTKVASKPKDPRPTGTPDVHLDGETVRHVLAATAHQPGSLIRRSLGDKGLHLHGEEGRHPTDTSSRLEGAIDAARSDAHFSNHSDRDKHVDALHRLALANLKWQGHELRQPQRWVSEEEHTTEPASTLERAARAVVTGNEPLDEDLLAHAHRIHPASGGMGLKEDELKRTLPNMSPFHRVLVSHNIARTLADRLEVAQHKIGGAPPSTLGKAAGAPPKGYRPIPNSIHSGYVKGHGAEAEYWYPNRRAATRAALDVVGRLAGHARRAHQSGLQADLTGETVASTMHAPWPNTEVEVLGAELDRPLVGPGSGREPHELDHPPAGFAPIPGSGHGGYHKRGPDGHWLYWYQGHGATTGPHQADHPEARGLRAISANPLRARHAVRDLLGTHKFIEGDGDSSGQLEIAQMSPVVRKRMAAAGVGLRARTAWE